MGSCCSNLETVVPPPLDALSKQKLDDSKADDTKRFVAPLGGQKPPYLVWAKVVKVYDGDTLTASCLGPNDSGPFLWSVRLSGIDSPEIRTRDEKEKEAALVCKKYLEGLVLNKIVVLKVLGAEKYGRILATVYVGGNDGRYNDVCELVLENTPSVAYDGGKKP